jgi:predicted RNA-binding Zn-ribbon protein involved in translation (DUF1610 family)
VYRGSVIYFSLVFCAVIGYGLVTRHLKTVKRCPDCGLRAARRTGPVEPTGETEKVDVYRFEVLAAEFTCKSCGHVFETRV